MTADRRKALVASSSARSGLFIAAAIQSTSSSVEATCRTATAPPPLHAAPTELARTPIPPRFYNHVVPNGTGLDQTLSGQRPSSVLLTSVICLLTAAFLALPATLHAQDFTWTTNADNTITITRYTGTNTTVDIPATITGLTVTSIGTMYQWPGAFSGNTNLISVTIPNSVTTIGEVVFYDCASLTSVTIGNSVTTIEDYAFSGCTSLTSVTIPNSVTNIGDYAFYSCTSLTSVTIPDSVHTIESETFACCTSLTNINIPNSVTHIGVGAFERCNRLTSITIPDSVTSIEGHYMNGMFMHCTSLTNVTIPNSVASIGVMAFRECTSLRSITIPNSVTNIGRLAFYSCTSLTSVTIGNSVTNIEDDAFSGCASLININIPNSVTTIGTSAFVGCTSLTSITIPNSVTSIGGGAFCGCTSLISITIPNSVASIRAGAFQDCRSLTNITIPNSVITIEYGAFENCTSLTNIYIPNSVTNIGLDAFTRCSSLTAIEVDPTNPSFSSLDGVLLNKSQTALIQYPGGMLGAYTIPDSVTSILWTAFACCTSLTNITIPKSVTSVGPYAFSICTNLTSVYFHGNAPSLGVDAFYRVPGIIYYLPGTTGWSPTFGDRPTALWVPFNYETNNGTITITGYTGPGGAVAIPDTFTGLPVTTIGYWAFSGCTSLTSITIPDSVTGILQAAFAGCTGLTNVTIGNSVTHIEFVGEQGSFGAFENCNRLANISVGVSNTAYSSLDGILFNKNQTELILCPQARTGSITIPDNITSIWFAAFSGCTSLTSITIPDSVTNIWGDAFFGCNSLAAVFFRGNAPSLGGGGGWFSGATNATIFYLPGTTGWGSTFGGRPTALWRPQAQSSDATFGIHINHFGFNIAWASGMTVVVESTSNLANPTWIPIATNTLAADSWYFTDPDPATAAGRFYRLRTP